MPLLPLPPGGTSLTGGDVPVTDASDVLAEFPEEYRVPDTAPVRDAFCEAFADGFVEYQNRAAEAAGQCDPLRAEDDYLSEIGESRGIPRTQGESDDAYRTRIFSVPDIVSPAAISSAVNTIMSPYTAKTCRYFEPGLDGIFLTDSLTSYGCYFSVSPSYEDRLFPDDAAANGGDFISDSAPLGPWLTDSAKRCFAIVVPVIDTDDEFAFVDNDESFFVGDGTDASGSESDGTVAQSVWTETLTSDELYATIISAVDSIKGQGMAWTLLADPSL